MRVQRQVCRGDPDAPHHRQVGTEVARRGLRDNVAVLGNCHWFGPRYDRPHWDHVKMGDFHVFFWGEGHIWEVLLLLRTVLPLSVLFSLEVPLPLQTLIDFPISAWSEAEDCCWGYWGGNVVARCGGNGDHSWERHASLKHWPHARCHPPAQTTNLLLHIHLLPVHPVPFLSP